MMLPSAVCSLPSQAGPWMPTSANAPFTRPNSGLQEQLPEKADDDRRQHHRQKTITWWMRWPGSAFKSAKAIRKAVPFSKTISDTKTMTLW
jgi:hypothetical protein